MVRDMVLELVFVSASILLGFANIIRKDIFSPEGSLFIIILGVIGAYMFGYHQKEREIEKEKKI